MNYPVMICQQENDNLLFTLPDMPGCTASESSIEIGIQKLKNVITNHLDILVEYGEQIPAASKIEQHMVTKPDNFLTWLLVEIDVLPYLGKSHKINVTLPELLISKIDNKVNVSEAYKTRSHFIAEACLKELKRSDI